MTPVGVPVDLGGFRIAVEVIVAQKREVAPPSTPEGDAADGLQDAHPTEPAEGAREPSDSAGSDRRAHPVDPAEGPRDHG